MSGAIDPEIHARLSPILDGLEKLRQQGNDEVSVPGVVVTGAQSAGKSSVLEALGGIKLPRGKNITTRVPLVLSLQNQPGAFPHHALIGKKPDISDMKEIEVAYISDEIQKLTVEIAGNTGRVNEEPIYLRVVRNTGPTLTLIDLPGITHYAPDGSDIHAQTVGLIEKYIKSENMVILVVIPAVDDFANAEALKLAKKYDPNGNRTLGVVTKADYVKPGSDIKAKLRMEPGQVQLQLGFIAVINRSAEEVERETPAEKVRAQEKEFFSTNAEVVGLEEEYWGLDTLVSRIVSLQVKRVLTFVPSYLKASRERIMELRTGLQKLPKCFTSNSERRDALHKMVSKIRQELHDRVVTGSVDGLIDTDKALSLAIVPRVTELYRKYRASIMEVMIPDFFSEEYSAKVTTTMKRVDGMGLSNMLSGRVCSPLIKDVFATDLVPLSMSLVTDVRQCMQDVLRELCDRHCSDHPTLLSKMKTSLVEDFMSDLEAKTEEVVGKLCQAELTWAFTQNPMYTRTLQDVKERSPRVREGEASSMEVARIPEKFIQTISDDKEDSVHDLQVSICVYADIVSTNICDTIPKIIHSLLVHGAIAGFVEWVVQSTRTDELAALLAEGSSSERKRRNFERRLAQYEEGVRILSNASFSV